MATLVELVEDGAFREARERVVELWRRKPHAELAALATELAVRAAAEKHVLASIIGGNSVASHKKLVEAFAVLAPDPAVFDWIVEELGHPRFDLSSGNPRKLYALIVAEMAKLKDERVAPWVAGLPAFLQAHKGRRHGQLSPEEIEALEQIFASHTFAPALLEALTKEESAEITAVRAPLDRLKNRAAEREDQRARLFAQVCADFEDDVAKEVLADFLLEEGNELGEFIVLGLKLAREGELPADLERRHSGLKDLARRFQPMGKRFDRGFAVEARFTDGEGIRRGSYGLEPEWGTIAVSDVPPTSDACHTQSLRELDLGSTFIADLAKLKKPLAVTRLRWRTPSQAGRAKWHKIAVLPRLERLTIAQSTDGTCEWMLLEGPGRSVRDVTIEHWSWGQHVAWICDVFAFGHGVLTTARVGPHLVFVRGDGRTKLTIEVPDAGVLAELQRQLTGIPRRLVDEVIVHGPGDASAYSDLLTLGRTHKAEQSASPAAGAASVRREGDALIIDPAPEYPVFDVPALRTLLATPATTGCRRVEITTSALIAETGAYWRAINEIGASELALTLGPPAWRPGRFALTVTADTLDVDFGRADQGTLVQNAIASLGGRVQKLIVRHPPSLDVVPKIAELLRPLTDELTLVPEDRVHAKMFRYANVKGRASLDPNAAPALLLPSTADLMLAGKPRPKELRVGQMSYALAPWIAWVAREKLAVTFAVDWKITVSGKISWTDGVIVRIWVDRGWPYFIGLLAKVSDQAIKHLDVQSHLSPTSEAIAACERVAQSHAFLPR